jgi:hypothetical protein
MNVWKGSDFVRAFNDNVAETERLIDIHSALTGKERGYRHNVEVLNKSGIVLLVACWEAFIEDLAEKLAGSGWKSVLIAHKKKILSSYLSSFNTPRPAQVDALFESLVGFKNLSASWKWKGMSVARSRSHGQNSMGESGN